MGYGELALLLQSPDAAAPVRVPFEFLTEIHRTDGHLVDATVLTRAFHQGRLPSGEVLVLEPLHPVGTLEERRASALRIPVEDIAWVAIETPGGPSVAGAVVLGVVVAVVLVFVILVATLHSASNSGCTSNTIEVPPLFSRVHLTQRPFDRGRGCFVGDPLAVADGWPAVTPGAPALATCTTPSKDSR